MNAEQAAHKCSALQLALSLMLAAAGPALLLWLMRHGVNYQDEPYQMLNALEWRCVPLAPLSAWVGNAWASIFGFTLISMRSLAVDCALASAAAASAWFYVRRQSLSGALALFGFTTAIFALSPWLSYLYGWDCLSTLSLVLLAIALLEYLRHPGIVMAIVIGAILGLASLMRLPNAVAALPCVIVVAWTGNRRWSRVGAMLTVAISVTLVLILIMYGSVGEYLAVLRSNIITGHTFAELLAGYGIGLTEYLRIGALVAALFAASCLVGRIFAPAVMWTLAAAIGVAAGMMIPSEFVWPGVVAHAASLWCLVAALIMIRRPGAVVFAIASMALVATAGADMGLTKVMSAPMLALALAYAAPVDLRRFAPALAAVLAMCAVAELRSQSVRSFEDEGYGHTTVLLSSTPLAGVCTTPERAAEIQTLDSLITAVHAQGGEVVAAGDCYRYAIDLLSRRPRPAAMRHAYLIDYPTYIPALMQVLAEAPQVSVVIATRPFDWRSTLPASNPASQVPDTAAITALPLGPVILSTPKFTVHAIQK